ncbi:MAG TPA: EthD domain-containing protein [Polyangiaceae bacterium]|nr:EthD domain-containing protein [Polyangiaceae bacterium]
MLKILAFLTKRQDLETRAFLEHYETKHIPLIRSLAPTPLVYKRSYLVRGDALNLDDGTIDFDVVTELAFADRDAYLAWAAAVFKPGNGEQVVADEERFLDRSRTRAFVVDEFVIAEQAAQRVATPEPTR